MALLPSAGLSFFDHASKTWVDVSALDTTPKLVLFGGHLLARATGHSQVAARYRTDAAKQMQSLVFKLQPIQELIDNIPDRIDTSAGSPKSHEYSTSDLPESKLPQEVAVSLYELAAATASPLPSGTDFSSLGHVPHFKIVTVGSDGVGKTCSFVVYSSNRFPSDYIPTTFEGTWACRVPWLKSLARVSLAFLFNITGLGLNILIDGLKLHFEGHDSPGHEEYDRLRPLTYPNTDVFLLMFSVSDRNSFVAIEQKFYPEVHQFVPNASFILVASKIDLRHIEDGPTDCVTREEGIEMAKRLNLDGYLEISSVCLAGVHEMYRTALRVAVYKRIDSLSAHKKDHGSKCIVQ